MSDTAEKARQSVLRAIDEYNASEERQIPRSTEAVLLGPGGVVDSLGLVRFIVIVERCVEDDFQAAVSLTDEKALSERNSPFRSVGALVAYVTSCLAPRP
jgi:D-alanine--poly(phosphoribitol) ligase subunit 2